MPAQEPKQTVVSCECGKRFRVNMAKAKTGFQCPECGSHVSRSKKNAAPVASNERHWSWNLMWMAWTVPVCIALLGALFIYMSERKNQNKADAEQSVATNSPKPPGDPATPSNDETSNPVASNDQSNSTPDDTASNAAGVALVANDANDTSVEKSDVPLVEQQQSEKYLYWIAEGGNGQNIVRRSQLNLSQVEDVFLVPQNAHVLTADSENQKLYWVTRHPGQVFESDLQGGSQKTLISSGLHNEQYGITAVDQALFLCGHTFILRYDIARQSMLMLPEKPLYPSGIHYDPGRDRIVWSNKGQIFECLPDGNGVSTLAGRFENINLPQIDTKRSRIYWIDFKAAEIVSTNLNGSDRRLLRKLPSQQRSLMYHSDSDSLYWATAESLGRISMSNLADETVIHPGLAGNAFTFANIASFSSKQLASSDQKLLNTESGHLPNASDSSQNEPLLRNMVTSDSQRGNGRQPNDAVSIYGEWEDKSGGKIFISDDRTITIGKDNSYQESKITNTRVLRISEEIEAQPNAPGEVAQMQELRKVLTEDDLKKLRTAIPLEEAVFYILEFQGEEVLNHRTHRIDVLAISTNHPQVCAALGTIALDGIPGPFAGPTMLSRVSDRTKPTNVGEAPTKVDGPMTLTAGTPYGEWKTNDGFHVFVDEGKIVSLRLSNAYLEKSIEKPIVVEVPAYNDIKELTDKGVGELRKIHNMLDEVELDAFGEEGTPFKGATFYLFKLSSESASDNATQEFRVFAISHDRNQDCETLIRYRTKGKSSFTKPEIWTRVSSRRKPDAANELAVKKAKEEAKRKSDIAKPIMNGFLATLSRDEQKDVLAAVAAIGLMRSYWADDDLNSVELYQNLKVLDLQSETYPGFELLLPVVGPIVVEREDGTWTTNSQLFVEMLKIISKVPM